MTFSMGKKIDRNSTYGQSPVKSAKKSMERGRGGSLENIFQKSSQMITPDNSVTAQFCDACGHEIFETEPYGPVSSLVEKIVASRDNVIKTSQQDSGELFVALIDETSTTANDLDVELSSLDPIDDVEMVDGGLLVKPDLWVGECDKCENESIFENPTNPHDVEPAVSVLKNQLQALKFIASDEATEQFEGFVESHMSITELNQARQNRDQSLGKFGPASGKTDLTGESEEFTMEFDNGSEIEFGDVYDEAELGSVDADELKRELEGDSSPRRIEDLDWLKDEYVRHLQDINFEFVPELKNVTQSALREMTGMGNAEAARLIAEVEK